MSAINEETKTLRTTFLKGQKAPCRGDEEQPNIHFVSFTPGLL